MDASVKRFQQYIIERGENTPLLQLDIDYIDSLLAVYLKQLKKKNGEDYEPVTIQTYCCCIRKYLSENMDNVDSDKSFPVTQVSLVA